MLAFTFKAAFCVDHKVGPKPPVVYTFSVSGTVNEDMYKYFVKHFEKAEEIKADHIIFEINSPGGLVSSCEKIRTLLLRSKIPTSVFINNNAASAAFLISISCDNIYMTPDGLIGACSVVSNNNVMPEKFQSFTRARARSSAELKGRDPKKAEEMVGRVGPNGNIVFVLSYTTCEAMDNGFCEGDYASLKDLIREKFAGASLFGVWESENFDDQIYLEPGGDVPPTFWEKLWLAIRENSSLIIYFILISYLIHYRDKSIRLQQRVDDKDLVDKIKGFNKVFSRFLTNNKREEEKEE